MSTPTRPPVHGLALTPLTQCAHWHSPLDIIAIKHKCCSTFYACISCHDDEDVQQRQQHRQTHPSLPWSKADRHEKAILCGACDHLLTIHEYMACQSKCPRCGSGFNPACSRHWALYFDL